MRHLPLFAATALFLASTSARAETRPADPTNYEATLLLLVPGDVLQLGPGTYENCLPLQGINGTAAQPITISGPASGPGAIFTATNCQDANPLRAAVVHFDNSSYLVVRNFEIDLQSLVVDGVEADYGSEGVHHITIEQLYIHDAGAQPANGISTKRPVWDWTIRGNRIERAGTGLYLGDSDGSAPFIRGTIEYNTIVDPTGYGMQIKHQLARPTITGIPTGASITVIRHNVFSKANGASLGDDARPNLLVGAYPANGAGSNDRYEIYGNFLYENGSGTEGLFQGEGNVAFHDNVLINTMGPGIFVFPHNGVPKEISIYHNTLWTSGRGIELTGGEAGSRQMVIANAIFAAPSMIVGEDSNNVTGTFQSASTFVVSASATLPGADFYPLTNMLSGPDVTDPLFLEHIDADTDFNGTVRDPKYRGAYAGEVTNPGFMLALATKPTVVITRPDGGVQSDSGVDLPDSGVQGDASEGTDATLPNTMDAGGEAGADAGVASVDTGVAAETPNIDTPGDEDEGCGCSTTTGRESSALFWLMVAAIAGIARTRPSLWLRFRKRS